MMTQLQCYVPASAIGGSDRTCSRTPKFFTGCDAKLLGTADALDLAELAFNIRVIEMTRVPNENQGSAGMNGAAERRPN